LSMQWFRDLAVHRDNWRKRARNLLHRGNQVVIVEPPDLDIAPDHQPVQQ